jgi:hypothetical protein
MKEYDLFRGPTPRLLPFIAYPKGMGEAAYVIGPAEFVGRIGPMPMLEVLPANDGEINNLFKSWDGVQMTLAWHRPTWWSMLVWYIKKVLGLHPKGDGKMRLIGGSRGN